MCAKTLCCSLTRQPSCKPSQAGADNVLQPQLNQRPASTDPTALTAPNQQFSTGAPPFGNFCSRPEQDITVDASTHQQGQNWGACGVEIDVQRFQHDCSPSIGNAAHTCLLGSAAFLCLENGRARAFSLLCLTFTAESNQAWLSAQLASRVNLHA